MDQAYESVVLDFPRLLAWLTQRAKIENTKQYIASLQPFSRVEDVTSDLSTLEEYISLAHKGITFTAEELPDMTPLFQGLRVEGTILSPSEISAFRRLLSMLEANAFLFREVKSHHEAYPHLYSLCAALEDYPSLRQTIDTILSPEGEIYENASPLLVEIRQKKHTLRKNIQQRLEEFIAQGEVVEFLQDHFVTVKEGRFVLPIKTSLKNVFQKQYQAILHSYSKSGETVYMEPAFIVDANNEVLEIDERELQEMWRLLGEITEAIRKYREELRIAFEVFPVWEWLDIRFVFWKENHGVIPRVSSRPIIRLVQVRHPFLGEKAVPIDIFLEKHQGLIISGPNAGGKTVSLKTIGLCTLMGLCGIPLPAAEATIGMFHQVYAEIGDEQNMDRELSSFTAQVTSLQRIWQKADNMTLVLIDEIASNTDPREGEALARAYISALLAKGAVVVVTTHYHGLKQMAYEDDRLQNASALFDRENLRPLYKLQYGEFSMSFALEMAKRYGLDSAIVERAYRYLEETLSPTEKLLLEIEKQKQLLAVKQQELEERLHEISRQEQAYQQRQKEIEAREKALREKNLEKISEELASLREQIADLKEKIKNQHLSPKELETIADTLEKHIKEEQKTMYRPVENPTVGQTVFVPSFQATGVIEAIHREKAKLRIGGVSLVVALGELCETADKSSRPVDKSILSSPMGFPGEKSTNLTIDVRGKTVDEALREVEKVLDKALLQGVSRVSVIHGMGEGILQRAIHDFLSEQKHVEKYEFAPPNEGGRGKTLVTLK
ncbi:MAG: Smr/MutS family protein [Brevinematales bacterium]|nr:Smr/MutS family protein [Brevinematales bacterium]